MDKFLVSKWDSLFGGVRQSILSKPTSDHFLILLEGVGVCLKAPLLSDSRTCGLRRRVSRTKSGTSGKVLSSEGQASMF